MMFRVALILALLTGSAQAQMWPFPGPGVSGTGGGSYTGPGDVIGSAKMWYGLRAYSAATAGTKAARICNASDANCADVNTLANGNFDVATATGSPLSCGGGGGTCTIRTLYDQTAGNNCTAATCDLGNATIANRPTLVLNCLGSLPCMAFASANSRVLLSTNSVTSIAAPSTYSAVALSTNTGASQTIAATNAGSATQLNFRASANNTAGIYANSNLNVAATDGSFYAIQGVIATGATGAMSINGNYTTGTTGTNALSATFSIGAISSSQYLTGQVAEVGVWASGFSSGQASSMSSNQRGYWGF